jgi:hypothetical protein
MSTSSTRTDSGPRSLHLVDIENLVGDPRADAAVVLDTFDRYLAAAQWSAADHMVVAANPGLMEKVIFDLPVPANKHCAPGPHGADGKLLDAVTPHTIAIRYDRLVIGSGDGIFGDRARAVRAQGVEVSVVARRDSCSYRLWGFAPTLLEPASLVLAA